jgi:hypothetical protein
MEFHGFNGGFVSGCGVRGLEFMAIPGNEDRFEAFGFCL